MIKHITLTARVGQHYQISYKLLLHSIRAYIYRSAGATPTISRDPYSYKLNTSTFFIHANPVLVVGQEVW